MNNSDHKAPDIEFSSLEKEATAYQWHTPAQDPIAATLEAGGDAALAFIVQTEGPSYRLAGAVMAVLATGHRVGSLSSGCIEEDISAHALAAREIGLPRMIRYGRGSPYIDLQLPCGGGMDILLLPRPDLSALRKVQEHRCNRQDCILGIDIASGDMSMTSVGTTGFAEGRFSVRFEPELQFFVFGKGPEASTFAKFVQSAGYPNLLLSPDSETLENAAGSGCATRLMVGPTFPNDIVVDYRTALVLFFHDHDWEPPVLIDALETDAFYIGAQGSVRARGTRAAALEALGVRQEQIARLKGPIGLIPSARDATTLAVSVLAEILAQTMPRRRS